MEIRELSDINLIESSNEYGGMLKRRTKNPFRRWKTNQYSLNEMRLIENNKTLIDFRIFTVSIEISDLNLIIKSRLHNILLQAADKADLKGWLEALNEHISKSPGRLQDYSCIARNLNWPRKRMSEAQLLENAQSGDILLCHTRSSIIKKCARCLTNSEYDHIVMLLREGSQLKIFEASYVEGVCTYTWQEANFDSFSPVTYRHIKFDRSEEELEKLHKFSAEVEGMKYQINPKYIFGVEKKQWKGYFCSELMIEAYKRIGLLPKDMRSYLFWPGDFADSFTLFLNDAYFEEEVIVDIGLHY